jgi:hypothetical protein
MYTSIQSELEMGIFFLSVADPERPPLRRTPGGRGDERLLDNVQVSTDSTIKRPRDINQTAWTYRQSWIPLREFTRISRTYHVRYATEYRHSLAFGLTHDIVCPSNEQ